MGKVRKIKTQHLFTFAIAMIKALSLHRARNSGRCSALLAMNIVRILQLRHV
jgi:hypothetical protein